jgi:23S rRNA pseudouridine1911/1915/1917 synthase
LTFSLGEEDAGERLDVSVASVAGVSRAQVRRWIEAGCVSVDGKQRKASHRVAVGEQVVATPPTPIAMAAAPEAIALDVLYEDSELIVIDKPPGMVVHPAPGHSSGTLVNALLYHCSDLAGVGGVLRPGIVHRLDRGTSGVMVAAKNDACHVHLARQFHDHTIHRVYWAFVRGLPSEDGGSIDQPIGRHPRDRKRMSVSTGSGREAQTDWRVAQRYPASGVAKLEIRPQTGRTHQIRVHLAWAGTPIVGDPVYGRSRRRAKTWGLERPALHAVELGFRHPTRDELLHFSADLPEDLASFRDTLLRREAGAGNS